MYQPMFGNDNAECDSLLQRCFVAFPPATAEKPILMGRWGTGKSALLLHANTRLEDFLVSRLGLPERCWYIREDALDLRMLQQLRGQYDGDLTAFRRALAELWRAEILRVYCQQLAALRESCGGLDGPHWTRVEAVAKGKAVGASVWRMIPDVVAIVLKDKTAADGARGIQQEMEQLLDSGLLDAASRCTKDLRAAWPELPCPVVAVEPVDSPTSVIDQDKGLAQALITALLNAYRSWFEPSDRQLIDVRLSIPWHRYRSDDLDFPQKLTQYLGHMRWSEARLRVFVNKRIEAEFDRVGRRFQAKGSQDAWSMLFPKTVKNDSCGGKVLEHSFWYVLRHTHYRARDLQRLTRAIVEKQADEWGVSADSVIAGRRRITESALRAAVGEDCRQSFKEFSAEVTRRYNNWNTIVGALNGISMPFTTGDLRKRMASILDASDDGNDVGFREIGDELWQGGLLGVEIRALTERAVSDMRQELGSEAYRRYELEEKPVHRWYFFEYNSPSTLWELLDRHRTDSRPDVEAGMVLHPKCFESLVPSLPYDCPIGA